VHQNPVCSCPLRHTCCLPRPSHSSRLADLNNIWWAAQAVKLLVAQSLRSWNLYQMTEINMLNQRAWKLWLSFRQIAHIFDAVPPCLVFAKSGTGVSQKATSKAQGYLSLHCNVWLMPLEQRE
jgi:hypothetical protein